MRILKLSILIKKFPIREIAVPTKNRMLEKYILLHGRSCPDDEERHDHKDAAAGDEVLGHVVVGVSLYPTSILVSWILLSIFT